MHAIYMHNHTVQAIHRAQVIAYTYTTHNHIDAYNVHLLESVTGEAAPPAPVPEPDFSYTVQLTPTVFLLM